MSKLEGLKIAVKFTLPISGDISNNISAFTLTGWEYEYTDGPNFNGPLINKSYSVQAVSMHPTEPDTLILDFAVANSFRNVTGELILSYNQAVGTLSGIGGAVQSFSVIFTPTELQEQPSKVRVREYVGVSVTGNIQMLLITKLLVYAADEYVTANVNGSIQLLHIDDINP